MISVTQRNTYPIWRSIYSQLFKDSLNQQVNLLWIVRKQVFQVYQQYLLPLQSLVFLFLLFPEMELFSD